MAAAAAAAGAGGAATGLPGGIPAPEITVSKGSAKRSFPFQGDETLEFIPLGAGNEVGRSCCLLKFKGKTIMFDCGAHPGYRGDQSLPFFDEVKSTGEDLWRRREEQSLGSCRT